MLLEVNRLTKEFNRGSNFFKAVDEVSFSMDYMDFISIIGKSGSGKSTLLNMIAGVLRPSQGSILLDGKEIQDYKDVEGSYLRNEQIGYVPQGQSLLANFSVIDNVRLPFFLKKRSGDPTERAFLLLDKVGISHLANSYPSQLSGGELKRAAIARALVNLPKILIADEPTSSLDIYTTREIMKLFASLSQECTSVLIVTHEPEVSLYCKSTFLMEAGKLSRGTEQVTN